MKIISLVGPSNVGKTTTLTIALQELIALHAVVVVPANVLGNPVQKDFSLELEWMGKKIAFFTMGDYAKHLVHAVDHYSAKGIDVLICACNSKFKTVLNRFAKHTCCIVPKTIEQTIPLMDFSNRLNAGTIISCI